MMIKSACIAAIFSLAVGMPAASQDYAQKAHDILERNCLVCHNHTMDQFRQANINEVWFRLNTNNPDIRMPKGQEKLNDKSINTIAEWIMAGVRYPDSNEDQLDPLSPQERINLIQAHLNGPSEFRRDKAVYFVIADPRDSKKHLGALSKLINSLSWKPGLVIPQPVDGSNNTIFYVDRVSLGWSDEIWEIVMNEDPYYLDPEISILFTDWFIAKASSGESLYHEILYPNIFTEEQLVDFLARKKPGLSGFGGVSFDDADDIIHGLADPRFSGSKERLHQAAGFEKSGVARYNRILDRIPFEHARNINNFGIYWKSYDFESENNLADIFRDEDDFQHAGNEMIFELPNGMHGYFITNRGGERLKVAPIDIVFDSSYGEVINGVSCMGCHARGIRIDFKNEMNNLNSIITKSEAESDRDRYLSVLESIEVDPPSNDRNDLVFFIYNNYEHGKVSKEKIATFFGLTNTEYLTGISNRGMTWYDFERRYQDIADELHAVPAAPGINSVNYTNKKITSWAKLKSN